MITIDSSLWIELFAGTELGKIIRYNDDYLNANFIVPSFVVTEVYKKLLLENDEYTALLFVTQMKAGKVVNLDFELALISAGLGKNNKLPHADSIIYATALQYNATLYTMDKHFEGLPNVQYLKKI